MTGSIVERLIEKAKESFVMAIEVYNKPSIRYRLEGFSFFICNAWELMLKAHLINTSGEDSVYYKDKPYRTISLENCIQKVFTNEKAPLRINLEKIIELRNTSTHFITEEYEMVYVPLLQACVFNFVDKMKEFHHVDMAEVIPENFITLSVRFNALDESVIRARYTHQVAERLVNLSHNIGEMVEQNNSNFAVRIEHQYYQTKKREEATELYHIAGDADEAVRIIKDLKDPNVTHKYNTKNCIKEINKRLAKEGVLLTYGERQISEINTFHFNLFVNHFGLKNNERYCYVHMIDQSPRYSYSLQAIDLIVGELKKAPDTILDDLKQKAKKQKEDI